MYGIMVLNIEIDEDIYVEEFNLEVVKWLNLTIKFPAGLKEMDFSWIWMILAAETGALDDQTLDGPGCESFLHKTILKMLTMMMMMMVLYHIFFNIIMKYCLAM